ncbi:hypothetical protein PsorP6_000119 [Peronosclerospora sorghi]|uniref:Uncharacterized protein n=1 Tax=Peronosclerospora sorghi TaxID=230839 RepID=A0ACC0WTS3_9STRA|nr:hypothetical protein PsorP6_000119 [Peronosclerospora sorghi]
MKIRSSPNCLTHNSPQQKNVNLVYYNNKAYPFSCSHGCIRGATAVFATVSVLATRRPDADRPVSHVLESFVAGTTALSISTESMNLLVSRRTCFSTLLSATPVTNNVDDVTVVKLLQRVQFWAVYSAALRTQLTRNVLHRNIYDVALLIALKLNC